VIQNVLAITGDEEIGTTVIVVVTNRDAHSVITIAGAGQAGGLSDIGEAAIAVLAVEAIPVARIRAIKIFRNVQCFRDASAVDEKMSRRPSLL